MAQNSIHRKLYEHVEEAIGLKIIKGEYSPEDTLPNEDALCEEFGVSRGVIREAVKVLNKKGLVVPRPKIGTQIQPQSRWNLFDADVLVWKLEAGDQLAFLKKVTEVRVIIESEAARFSAERATAEEIADIKLLYNQLEDTFSDRDKFDYEAYLEADMAFHTAILESSHNELLAQIGRTMRHAIQTARQADVHDVKVLAASLQFHAAIVAALEKKDPESAYKASSEMFDQVWKYLPE